MKPVRTCPFAMLASLLTCGVGAAALPGCGEDGVDDAAITFPVACQEATAAIRTCHPAFSSEEQTAFIAACEELGAEVTAGAGPTGYGQGYVRRLKGYIRRGFGCYLDGQPLGSKTDDSYLEIGFVLAATDAVDGVYTDAGAIKACFSKDANSTCSNVLPLKGAAKTCFERGLTCAAENQGFDDLVCLAAGFVEPSLRPFYEACMALGCTEMNECLRDIMP